MEKPHLPLTLTKRYSIFFLIRKHPLLLAIIVGVITGLIAVAFKSTIEHLSNLINIITSTPIEWLNMIYLTMIIGSGGIIAGLIVKYMPEATGSGIPEIKLQLAGLIKSPPHKNIIAKFLGGVATVGTGFSLGPEGPVVTMGAGIGKLLSSSFNLSGKKERLLISSGAGAGLAAAFNTPIAGVVFVLEELIHNFSAQFLTPCILAAVIATTIVRYFSGTTSYLQVNYQPELFGIEHILSYASLAILAGICGTAFIKVTIESLNFYDKEKDYPVWVKIGITGVITAVAGIFLPDVIGSGHSGLQKLANGEIFIWIALIYLIFKLLLTALAYGSGAPGGIFAPALFCGAALGLFYGKILTEFLPFNTIIASNMALVGMAAFFTAVFRTPITASIAVFELTGDYRIILPLLLSSILANIISVRIIPKSIYPALILRSRGIELEEDPLASPLEHIKVSNIMSTAIITVLEAETLNNAFEKMKRSQHNGFPVLSDQGKLVGVITLSDIETAFLNNINPDTSVTDIMTRNLITLPSDKAANVALEIMFDKKIGRIIIVDRNQPDKLIGIVTKTDILKAELKVL